ncbi:MAG: hypothetical protein CL910_02285 [Deltaproteobacteria bacterium]|nr:hypothetical protein [Deltaproteobacteria bacterium]
MKRMRPFVLVTDLGFILYWSVSLLILLGFEVVPEAWLFKDYDDPIIYAWNWSFFPLDMVLSGCGLLALRRHARDDPSWRGLAAFSLALTFCAGFMAICFWAIRLDFDPSWWAANLFLAIWPLFFLPGLVRADT